MKIRFPLIGLAWVTVSWASVAAQTLTTLNNFSNANGSEPRGGMIADANGNLFGAAGDGEYSARPQAALTAADPTASTATNL